MVTKIKDSAERSEKSEESALFEMMGQEIF